MPPLGGGLLVGVILIQFHYGGGTGVCLLSSFLLFRIR